MNAKDIKYFEEKLKAELATLEGEMATVGRKNPDNPKDWEAVPEQGNTDTADETEIADSMEALEGNAAILNQLEIRYNEVKAALERIQKGAYGVCTISGDPIERDRLEANPAALTCKKHL